MRKISVFLCLSLCLGKASLYPQDSFFSLNPLMSYLYCDKHWVFEKDQEHSLLTLEDRSQWKVSDEDIAEVASWKDHELVEISPNYLSSSHAYYITNKETDSYVQANLISAPLRGSPYAVTIKGTNYRYSFSLSNGTKWEVSFSDLALVRNWYVNDLVIIGVNNEWFSSYTHILINTHTNTFVRVQKM
jgi:hypothetical protein